MRGLVNGNRDTVIICLPLTYYSVEEIDVGRVSGNCQKRAIMCGTRQRSVPAKNNPAGLGSRVTLLRTLAVTSCRTRQRETVQ
jgi:hypothetical protein